MLSVFLCENDEIQRNSFEKVIKDTVLIEDLDINFKLATNDPNQLLTQVSSSTTSGIYFLDIDLNYPLNGFQLAEKIRSYDPSGFIIFITSHAEMAYLTFVYKIEALDFIIKNNFKMIKQRIYECIVTAYERYTCPYNIQSKSLKVNLGDKTLCFNTDEIIYIETSENVHRLILHTKERKVEFYGKMKDIELSLCENFIRIHKSFIVNKKKINEIDRVNRIVHMENGDICLASVRLIKNLYV
ncbi:LytR/AlgR family response regulator transcription factor [Clostridium cellulovorans]|uniref:Stage 0 sporulation protein A homolog n=1 Tax=Clostridium cellulovorans (strain ATCC 35296 / DSM 3052 / OCM 3 / 743B) TaxID=573061 RepID=D9SNC7_CLOC7|nr:LytTR family DNA-binding domain-containing protein [Clostridium cellulovorans]ADL53919.1 two component transcriptional regulator, LytTR family [Clostridium cellulovorans 743B]